MTERQCEILQYLKGKDWTSPTEIGHLFGGHSSTGSPICKSLVKMGLIQQNEKGWYKLK